MGGRGLPTGVGTATPASLERYGVTGREVEVLEALGERLSNAEIASRLYVSRRTVESHVASLMRKLGVTRRRELAQIWATSRPGDEPAERSLPPALQLLADPATFVGRQSERTRLRELWHRVTKGQLLVAVVVGEAGIGKSRIAAEFALEVQQDGGQVRLGACFEDLGLPYEPFVQIIGADVAWCTDSELDERARSGARVLAWVVPELATRLDVAAPSMLAEGPFERAMLLSALHGYLGAMAVRAPQLVVVEDLHWSTATTRDALRHICRIGAAVPMLVLVTCRDAPPDLDEALATFLSDLSRQPSVEVIALSGLSEDEVGGLLPPTTSVTAAEVHAATDGNPLLALEAVRTDSGPRAMTGLLVSRYDRLARTELDVLDVAVVVGAAFDATLVAAAADRSVEDTVKALESAEQAGLITAVPGLPGRFTFVHSLFRTVRYDSLMSSTRRQLHRSVAAVLRPRADDEGVLPVLAHHVCAATPFGDAEEALDLARRAGHLARRRFALDEAAVHFRRALAMFDLNPSSDRRLRLHLEIDLADAQLNAGQAEGRSLLLAAVREARRRADHEALANATLALTRLGARTVGDRDDPRIAAAIRDALATIPTEPTRIRARLLAGLSFELGTDDLLLARELACQAIDMARQLDDLPTLGHALLTYRSLIYEPALADEREAVCTELTELGRRLDDPTLSFGGLAHLFALRREAGDIKGMDDMRAQLTELSAIYPSPFARMSAIARDATDHFMAGDLVGAETAIDQLSTPVEASMFDSFEIYAPHLLVIRYQQGRIGELLPMIEHAAATQSYYRAYTAVLVMALARAGRLDAATEALNRLAADDYDMPHNANWFVGTEVLADGVDILGSRAVAAVLRDRLAPFGGRIAHFIHGVSRPADEALAQVMLTLGDLNGAAEVATRAIDASRKRCTPVFLGRELVLLAAARHRAGRPTEHVQPLVDEAHHIARATGAHLIDQEITRYGLPTVAS